jgi:hypothetical protein
LDLGNPNKREFGPFGDSKGRPLKPERCNIAVLGSVQQQSVGVTASHLAANDIAHVIEKL